MRLIASALILIFSSLSFAGPGSGGGGGTGIKFKRDQCVMLVDILTLHPEYADSNDRLLGRDCPVEDLKRKYPEFEEINANDRLAVDRAMEILNLRLVEIANSKTDFRTGFAFVMAIRRTLKNTSFLRTSHQFKEMPYYISREITAKFKRGWVATLGLHLPSLGVLISSPGWDTADTNTQAMVLIHETLRQFQEEPSQYGLKDPALQRMNALLFEPRLDIEDFAQQMLTAPRLVRRFAFTGRLMNADLKTYIGADGVVRDVDVATEKVEAGGLAMQMALTQFGELDRLIQTSQHDNARKSFMQSNTDEKRALIKQLVKDGVLENNYKWTEK